MAAAKDAPPAIATTTAILTTIEHRFGLDPLTDRDKAQNDLSSIWAAKKVS